MTLGWILAASFAGGTLSAGLAAFSLTLRASWVPMLVSYAIGALLGAAFLGVIPEAFAKGPPQHAAAAGPGTIAGRLAAALARSRRGAAARPVRRRH